MQLLSDARQIKLLVLNTDGTPKTGLVGKYFGVNEIQTITYTGEDNIRLSYNGNESTELVGSNSTMEEVRACLESIGELSENVACSGDTLATGIDVEYTGGLAATNVPNIGGDLDSVVVKQSSIPAIAGTAGLRVAVWRTDEDYVHIYPMEDDQVERGTVGVYLEPSLPERVRLIAVSDEAFPGLVAVDLHPNLIDALSRGELLVRVYDVGGTCTSDIKEVPIRASVGDVYGIVQGHFQEGVAFEAGQVGVRAADTNGNMLAQASTALSSAVWTSTKAGYLDAAISSRSSHSAADAATAVWGAGSRTITGGSLTTAPPTKEQIASQVRTELATELGRIDAKTTEAKLAADGLDAIAATEPTAKPTTFPGWIMWLIQRFRRASKTATALNVLTEAGETVTTQTITSSGDNETLGPPQ